MFKNVTLRKRNANGHPTWLLLGPDGQSIPAFSAFIHALRNDAKNTLDSYARHLAEFIDYLIEVSVLYGGRITKLNLTEAIEAYIDYLQYGVDAHNKIASAVAFELPPSVNSVASLGPKMAAIRRFLRLSENIRKEMAELACFNTDVKVLVDVDPLLPELARRRELRHFEVRAMQGNSMLAGVIADGPKFIDCVVFQGQPDNIPYEQSRAFPYEKVIELIDTMPTFRDKTLYSLLAASGCRTHEALQLLLEDIDVTAGKVILVPPKLRAGHASYRALPSEVRKSMGWKGRATQLTFLIEPFSSKFFESLKGYIDHERIAHGKDDFVFQYIEGRERGMPYFLSAASTRLELFHRVCNQIGVDLPRGTAGHSLRHMYGTYLLNYFPRASGEFGFPPAMVQQIMGHASIKSTMKYARYDQDLLKLEIKNANHFIFRNLEPKKLNDLKMAALESQVSKLRKKFNQEAIFHD